MSLKEWENNHWLKSHKTSKQEIQNLLEIVERDLKDASKEDISADWRFGIAYNAALKLCTILLYCEGYRADRNLAHYRTLMALPLILGSDYKKDATYLDSCRKKRNIVEYDCAGGASDSEAKELISFVQELHLKVIEWLKTNHAEFIG